MAKKKQRSLQSLLNEMNKHKRQWNIEIIVHDGYYRASAVWRGDNPIKGTLKVWPLECRTMNTCLVNLNRDMAETTSAVTITLQFIQRMHDQRFGRLVQDQMCNYYSAHYDDFVAGKYRRTS